MRRPPPPSRTLDRADWPEWAVEEFEERAAILTYDAGLDRERAEREAWGPIRLRLERIKLDLDWRRR